MKIAVAGTGYVGLSIATLLSQHHEVMAVDIIPEKVELINQKKSPIQDEYIEKYLSEKMSIPIEISILFGNSEHPFPERKNMPFRSRVQPFI